MKINKSKRVRMHLKQAASIRFPKDYHWKLMTALSTDLEPFLSTRDIKRVKALIRDRSLIGLVDGLEDWDLQSMNLSDQHNHQLVARYQLSSFLKKFELSTDISTCKASALEKFHKAEAACKEFNLYGYDSLCRSSDPEVFRSLTYARSFIRKVLGPLSTADLSTDARHGPGATLDTKGGYVNRYEKYRTWPYSCSRRAFGKAVLLIRSDKRWLGALEDDYRKVNNIHPSLILDQYSFWHNVIKIDDTNRVTFVPKSAKTFRTIAIESPLNLMLQLGVDGHIRRRLKRWDIDLDDQSKNQRLARLGSVNDAYCTVDLSAASDSISLGICKYLLPTEWYNYLIDLRAHTGLFEDGSSISYQKISSMGNGYTFALESLIFASLVYGASIEKFNNYVRHDVAIYGDDLITPISLFPLLRKLLNQSGFQLNLDKSFISGPVRESCGADYFHGKLVRPVFLHKPPKDLKDVFNDYNRIKRILNLRYGIRESAALDFLFKFVPAPFKRFVGPYSDEEFDTYLHTENPTGSYVNDVWKYSRLVKVSSTYKDEQCKFHFRKLMHSLRGKPALLPSSTSSGCNFELTRRRGGILKQIPSETSIWSSEYTDIVRTKPCF